ncbi:hypothetical protein N5E91_04980 [Shewanella xiamenensis]|uniref:hypothetical protein n=1 Tax=Shewanella xiamenensis TaxID=332186 RepID=UPI0024497C24|nr:hypothetical protein [Shewanella xiamenensis]MDH1625472.1 hypothetical protein [Shewanella xiamenensis]
MINIITTVSSQILILFFSLITNKVAASTLSPENYAVYGQAILFSSFVVACVCSGFQNCLLSKDVSNKNVLFVYFNLSIVSSFLLYFVSHEGYILKYLLIDVDLYISPLYLLVLPILYQLFVFQQSSIVSGGRRIDYVFFNTGNAFLCSLLMLITLYYEIFFLTFILILVRPGLLGVIKFWSYFKGLDVKSFFSRAKEKQENVKALSFLLYGIVATVSTIVFSMVIRYILSSDSNIKTVGYFFTAQRIFELLLGLSVTYYSTYYYKTISAIENKSILSKIVIENSCFSLLFFSTLSLILYFYSTEIVLILFSETQLPATSFFAPLILNMCINSVVYTIGFALLSKVNKFKLALLEVGLLIMFFLFSNLITPSLIVWLLPIFTSFKLIINVFLFYNLIKSRSS